MHRKLPNGKLRPCWSIPRRHLFLFNSISLTFQQAVKITVGDDMIVVEDNGIGMDKNGLRQYFTIGSNFKRQNPISHKLKRVRIGEFGIGKFAVLSICDRFEIYTRTQNYAATLIFDREDFETRSDWNISLIEHIVETLTTGTRVSLFRIKKPISLLAKKIIRVLESLEKSAISYQDKKAEKILSDALLTVREALKKNTDILFLEGLSLF